MIILYIGLACVIGYTFCAGVTMSFLGGVSHEDKIVTSIFWPIYLLYSIFHGLLMSGMSLGIKLQTKKSKGSYSVTVNKL